MAQFKSYDACRNVCSTLSTGVLTLGDNITGAQSIKAKMSTGDTAKFYFRKGSQWISFLGTFTSPDQLARTRIIDGSGGLATNVDFAAGAGEVAIDVSAEDLDDLNLIEVSVTSAATCDIGAAYGRRIVIAGTTGPITSFGTSANKLRIVRHSGSTITHHATSLILKGNVNRVTVANDIGIYVSDASGNWMEIIYSPAVDLGKLISWTIYTADNTHNRATGCKSQIVEVRGGGGGGGGATNPASVWTAAGGGGQGGRALKRITSPNASETVTVGAAGAAGSSGGGNGGTGGTSSFGSNCSATGGVGGTGNNANTSVAGGAGGLGSSGDINFKGQGGGVGIGQYNAFIAGGTGGGEGGGIGAITSAVGGAGVLGGGGGGSGSGGAGVAGSVGGTGYVIVWEYG